MATLCKSSFLAVCFLCWLVNALASPTNSTASKTTPKSSPKYKDYKFETCNETNLDECAKVVFLYGNRQVHMPTNAKEMKPHCSEEKLGVKCVLDWGRKCLKSFPKQALFMMMSGATRNIRERCSPSGTKYYLKNKKCVLLSADSQHTCMEMLTKDINSIRRNKKKSEWLPSVCCLVEKWRRCARKGAQPFCDSEGMKFLRWGADAYVADLTDLACSNKLSWGSDRCVQLMDNIPDADQADSQYKPQSVLLPMFKIITEYADWDKREPPKFKRFE